MEDERTMVLVVDDEPMILEFVQFVLEEEGYAVVVAVNGKEGEKLCEEHAVSLLITDLIMPDKEGLETIGVIRENHPAMKVIAMSGAVNSETYLKIARKLGAEETLEKPFDRNALVAAVRRVMNTEKKCD